MKIPKARKMSSGSWYINLRLGGESISVTEKTEKACIREAQRVKAEYLAGKRERVEVEEKEPAPTLDAVVESYINSKEGVLSPSTIRGYETIKRTRFQTIMQTPVDEIGDWQTVISNEAGTCSAKTLKSAWGLVHASLSAKKFPVPDVTLPQVVPATRPWLDTKQAKAFVKLVANEDFAIPALLALHGLRRSEIMGLWWSNVDLDNELIHVHGSTVRQSTGGFVDKDTNKNQSSRRTVPIMIPELKKALSRTKQEERLGKVCSGSFDRIWEKINALCAENGLPQVGFHGLRHSFASIGYSLGVSELEMMKLGGWSDTKTMHKIYTHIAEADLLKSKNKIANFFGGEIVEKASGD